MSINEFFYFHRSDRSIVCIVAVAAIGVVALMRCSVAGMDDTTSAAADSTRVPHAAGIAASGRAAQSVGEVDMPRSAELFCFDPNTADSTALLRLGMQPWQVRNIYRYRARGGVYRRPSDFARTYGLTAGQYRRLEPYIRIAPDFLPAAEVVPTAEAEHHRDTTRYVPKMRQGEVLALNAADTTALQRVPGIGSYYARQIVRRRTQLGGFSSVAQLAEIDGFPTSAMPYFKVDAGSVVKLDVNRLTLSQLKRHPYINFYQARAIVDYRRLHGELRGVSDLRMLKEFSEQDVARLSPYLEFR